MRDCPSCLFLHRKQSKNVHHHIMFEGEDCIIPRYEFDFVDEGSPAFSKGASDYSYVAYNDAVRNGISPNKEKDPKISHVLHLDTISKLEARGKNGMQSEIVKKCAVAISDVITLKPGRPRLVVWRVFDDVTDSASGIGTGAFVLRDFFSETDDGKKKEAPVLISLRKIVSMSKKDTSESNKENIDPNAKTTSSLLDFIDGGADGFSFIASIPKKGKNAWGNARDLDTFIFRTKLDAEVGVPDDRKVFCFLYFKKIAINGGTHFLFVLQEVAIQFL